MKISLCISVSFVVLLMACNKHSIKIVKTSVGYDVHLNKIITDRLPVEGKDVQFTLLNKTLSTSILARAMKDQSDPGLVHLLTKDELQSLEGDRFILISKELSAVPPDDCGPCESRGQMERGVYSEDPPGCFCL